MPDHMTRRNLAIAGGFGLVVATMFRTSPTAAKTMTDDEKANVKLTKEYFEDLAVVDLDVDKLTEKYFAPNCLVRWLADEMPPVIGPKQAALQLKPFVLKGSTMPVKFLDIFARGPIVVTSRLDMVKVPGKPDEHFNLVGVHVIKNGKFVEYTDWMLR